MPLKQVQQCAAVTDCVVSDWSAWDACDKTCGGGSKAACGRFSLAPKTVAFHVLKIFWRPRDVTSNHAAAKIARWVAGQCGVHAQWIVELGIIPAPGA